MRRPLAVVLLMAMLSATLSACGPDPPSSRPSALPVSPSAAPQGVLSSPSLGPSPTRPAPSSSPVPVDPLPPDPSAAPLAYDWATFPRLPTPILAADDAQVAAAAVAGCITRYYEPRDDLFGRVAQSEEACRSGPLPRTAPLVVVAGAPLSARAPAGFQLGAEVAIDADVYAIVWASRGIPARIDGMSETGLAELAREMGFNRDEIAFAAPAEPGDYLVGVAAQLGSADRTYRELGTIFLYYVRVTAG